MNSISIIAYLRDNPIRIKKNGFLVVEFMINLIADSKSLNYGDTLRRLPEVKEPNVEG